MTHSQAIAEHLKKHGTITPMIALNEYGCYRLSARIKELRSVMDIKTERVPYINHEGKKKTRTIYRMVE